MARSCFAGSFELPAHGTLGTHTDDEATRRQPCQVDTYVKSQTPHGFGRSPRNCRSDPPHQ